MNTLEIEKTVLKDKRLKKMFLGVFPSDELPEVTERPCCFIANTDASDKPGEHWIAMYFDKYVEYFDSYGLEPRVEFKIYKPDLTNNYCLQGLDTAVCGEYCIYYLLKRSRKISLLRIVDFLRKKSNSDNFVKTCIDKLRSVVGLGQYQCCKRRQ